MTYPLISAPQFVQDLSEMSKVKSKSLHFTANAAQTMIRQLMGCTSPHRGMLLFHALGTGKTCAAIGVAESVLACRETSFIDGVIVMLAASLEDSFISEIVNTCGQLAGSKWIKHVHGWTVSHDGTHYRQLSQGDQLQVQAHIDRFIRSQYEFLHFNGITKSKLRQLASKHNPFDNKLVIFDEVHNLTKSLANGGSSELHVEIFKLLLTAKQCKIVAMSATPMVNSVAEIGFIISMLRGLIDLYVVKIHIARAATVMKLFKEHPCIYRVDLDMHKHVLTVQFVPEHFQLDHTRAALRRRSPDTDNMTLMNTLIRPFQMSDVSVVQHVAFPLDADKFKAKYLSATGHPQNVEEFATRVYGHVSFYQPSSDIFPDCTIEVDHAEMSDYQCDVYIAYRRKELRYEKKLRNKDTSLYRSYSRRACDFVFPPEIKRYFKSDLKIMQPDNTDAYQQHIDQAIEKLRSDKRSHKWLSTELSQYSAKYNRMLRNLARMPSLGTALIYSEFRNVPEGIPVISAVLDANGFERFDLHSVNLSKKRYLVYDTTRKSPSMQQLLNIFNNQMHLVEPDLKQALYSTFGKDADNLKGRIISTLIISASASEGISLKNVRQVHVMQSFWQNVRIEQVIGRARRSYSHHMLPVTERNVKVYMYLTTMSPSGKENALRQIREDVTSDEHVYSIAETKSVEINQFIDVLQRSSIDCPLWKYKPCIIPTRSNLHSARSF